MRRAGLLLLAVPVVAYQIRFGLDAIWAMQSLAVYLPFDVRPFSNRLARQILQGQELVAVNGKPFVGYSTYVPELWRVARQPADVVDPALFETTIRDFDGRVRPAEITWARCTCGGFSDRRRTSIG